MFRPVGDFTFSLPAEKPMFIKNQRDWHRIAFLSNQLSSFFMHHFIQRVHAPNEVTANVLFAVAEIA